MATSLFHLMARCVSLGTAVGGFDGGADFWSHGWQALVAVAAVADGTRFSTLETRERMARHTEQVRVELAPLCDGMARGIGNFVAAFCAKVASALQ